MTLDADADELTKFATNYIVSAQKPTVVNAAVVGNFRGPDTFDLIVARVNRIELLLVTPEGLKPHREIPVFGRIAVIKAFRPPGEQIDSLLILTVKYHLAILKFDESGEVSTRAFGTVSDRVGRPSETGIIASVHASGTIALRLYDGLLKIIQWQDDKELKSFNLRFEDHNVTDVTFLHLQIPTIAYICQDNNGRHLKVCQVDLVEKDLLPPSWKQENIESEASLLIPVPAPFGGVVVIGQESISYHRNQNHFMAIAPPLIHMTQFNCYGAIDKTGDRFLLGDVELVGEISIPECLVYLDNYVVFVGSRFGDSQLIRLSVEPLEQENAFIQLIDSFPNLGPIRDLILLNTDGQNQIVTCSGAFKDGSLRVVRSGIGIDEVASIDIPSIKGLHTLRMNSDLDNCIVVSLIDVTHVIQLNGEELEDTEMPGFELNEPTFWAGNLSPTRVLQVNATTVRLIACDSSFVKIWKSPHKICLSSVNPTSGQIMVASGAHLLYLRIVDDEIVLVGQTECENEAACLDISPIGDGVTESKVFAVGFWGDNSVALISLEGGFRQVVHEKLSADVLPRTVLLITLERVVYLLVSLGDGTVYYFLVDQNDGSLTEHKKVTLGTQPTTLRKFTLRGATNVFACSDRPAVIYSSNKKLAFSNVNLKLVTHMCSLNSEAYKDCLLTTDGVTLMIGNIDDIQKLHIRTVPLRESVSRIAHQPETGTLAILTNRIEHIEPNGERSQRPSISTVCTPKTPQSTASKNRGPAAQEPEHDEVTVHSVCILDHSTFDVLHVYELGVNEVGMSLTTAMLADDPRPYYAVGTAFVNSDETESKQGRVLVFQYDPDQDGTKFFLVAEKEVKGAVFSITSLANKLICSINSSVRLFEWMPDKELRLECSHFNFISALYLKTKGDLVLVGDLMRSVCLLSYKQMDSSFEEIARDYSTEWMSACEIVDSDTFLGAENNYNIFSCAKDVHAENEEERMRLQQAGLYYLGEFVNVFRRGTLMSDQTESSTPFSNPIIYGTADGGLGAIVQLPEGLYKFLLQLQKRVAKRSHNCLRIEHDTYRNFSTEKRTERWQGFIDGDLVETIADMPREHAEEIVRGLRLPNELSEEPDRNATVEDALKIIEDLSRVH
ncbi:UV-damaged DNA binding factor (ISS) [Aphelenchoides avenae]|nr:UV-damaged DNA binding factor (ISS) [Aphelenchus avenae]